MSKTATHPSIDACAPACVTDYRLDTTLQGGLSRVTAALARVFPRLLRIPMPSPGSPVTEWCRVGCAPDSTTQQRAAWLDAILAHMETVAAGENWACSRSSMHH